MSILSTCHGIFTDQSSLLLSLFIVNILTRNEPFLDTWYAILHSSTESRNSNLHQCTFYLVLLESELTYYACTFAFYTELKVFIRPHALSQSCVKVHLPVFTKSWFCISSLGIIVPKRVANPTVIPFLGLFISTSLRSARSTDADYRCQNNNHYCSNYRLRDGDKKRTYFSDDTHKHE